MTDDGFLHTKEQAVARAATTTDPAVLRRASKWHEIDIVKAAASNPNHTAWSIRELLRWESSEEILTILNDSGNLVKLSEEDKQWVLRFVFLLLFSVGLVACCFPFFMLFYCACFVGFYCFGVSVLFSSWFSFMSFITSFQSFSKLVVSCCGFVVPRRLNRVEAP